jgi:hypothetical protein
MSCQQGFAVIGRTAITSIYQEGPWRGLESHDVRKVEKIFAALYYHSTNSFSLNTHIPTHMQIYKHVYTDTYIKQIYA